MSKKYQQELANQILRDLSRINPYTASDRTQGALYAAGFLAGYIAQLAEQDPWTYKKLKHYIDSQTQKPR